MGARGGTTFTTRTTMGATGTGPPSGTGSAEPIQATAGTGIRSRTRRRRRTAAPFPPRPPRPPCPPRPHRLPRLHRPRSMTTTCVEAHASLRTDARLCLGQPSSKEACRRGFSLECDMQTQRHHIPVYELHVDPYPPRERWIQTKYERESMYLSVLFYHIHPGHPQPPPWLRRWPSRAPS